MKKIETDSDVRDWAKAVVEANGEKFTPLSKGEQFVIARLIVGMNDGCGGEDTPSTEEAKPEAPTETATEVHADVPFPSPSTSPRECCSCTVSDRPTPQTVQCTRFEGLHRSGLSAQQAYDIFLEWCEEHPKEGSVMDFSTGAKSRDAAFSYWLCDTVLMEVPITET